MCEEKISIIMGVYNCSETINEAIDSILNQSYKNWQFIICDDCSTDNTYEILLTYKKLYPDKFIIVRNDTNSRLAASLNHCLRYATGKYVARMDGDDISHPERLEKQLKYLQENPNIDLVGTSMQRFNEHGMQDILYSIEKPNKYVLKNKVPFNHATILTYKSVYDKLGGYTVSDKTKRSQDYELWFRFYNEGFVGSNLKEPLYYVREDSAAIRRRTFKVRFNSYRIAISGYKLLKFPFYWYIPLTAEFLFKVATPYFVIDLYRKYQSKKAGVSIVNNKL